MITIARWVLLGTFLCLVPYQENAGLFAAMVLGFILIRSYSKV